MSLPPDTAPPRTLGERLQRLRTARFVGRTAEIDTFAAMLDGRDPHALLLVHGPGGIGKSTLLAEFGRMAEQGGRNVVALDGRLIQPNPQAFEAAVHEALGQRPGEGADTLPEGLVLIVDTLERLAPLEAWLLRAYLPTLPGDALVVLAGRQAMGGPWLLEPGCGELALRLALPALHASEVQAFLLARGVAQPQQPRVAELARGNPLALTLLADAVRAGRLDVLASVTERRQLFRQLTERFATDAPSALHERALQTLMFARTTTEAMLADAVSREHAPTLYGWLRQQAYVDEGDHGLQPHDLVREAFEADWFTRGSDVIEPLRVALMQHLQGRMMRLGQHERSRLALDWTYLARDTAAWQILDWTQFEHHLADHLAPQDAPEVIKQIARALGPEHARVAAHWLQRQPQGWRVVRPVQPDPQRRLMGCWLQLDMQRIEATDLAADAALAAVACHLASLPPFAPDDLVQLQRLAVFDGSTVLPNPTFDLGVMLSSVDFMTDTRLAWSGLLDPDPARLAPLFDNIQRYHWHHRIHDVCVSLDGHALGLYARHWRAEPNPLWWNRPPGWRPSPEEARQLGRRPQHTRLDRDAFATAVRDALKAYARPDQLAASPLLGCDLMTSRHTRPDAHALRELLHDAVHALAQHPRDLKFHHALRLTWLDPGASQEQVATELGLPFNTYRYHLARGVERVVQGLWQRELSSGQPSLGLPPQPPSSPV